MGLKWVMVVFWGRKGSSTGLRLVSTKWSDSVKYLAVFAAKIFNVSFIILWRLCIKGSELCLICFSHCFSWSCVSFAKLSLTCPCSGSLDKTKVFDRKVFLDNAMRFYEGNFCYVYTCSLCREIYVT